MAKLEILNQREGLYLHSLKARVRRLGSFISMTVQSFLATAVKKLERSIWEVEHWVDNYARELPLSNWVENHDTESHPENDLIQRDTVSWNPNCEK